LAQYTGSPVIDVSSSVNVRNCRFITGVNIDNYAMPNWSFSRGTPTGAVNNTPTTVLMLFHNNVFTVLGQTDYDGDTGSGGQGGNSGHIITKSIRKASYYASWSNNVFNAPNISNGSIWYMWVDINVTNTPQWCFLDAVAPSAGDWMALFPGHPAQFDVLGTFGVSLFAAGSGNGFPYNRLF
jgi:hypothetical protein